MTAPSPSTPPPDDDSLSSPRTETHPPAAVFSFQRNSSRPLFPIPPASAFIAGALAGAASRTCVSPLERLKIILQVQGAGAEYRGVIPSLAKMWREEGWRGYMKGNGINVLRIAPYSAVQFSAYELVSGILQSNGADMDTPRRLLAGSIAGVCSVASTYPLDLIRSRLSIESASLAGSSRAHKSTGIVAMTSRVYRTEGGIKALYRGIVPTAVGVAPYVAISFASYSIFKDLFSPADGSPPGTLIKLASGAAAGSIAQTLTYPLDVLRRRMQVVGVKSLNFAYTGAWHAVTVIVKTEGPKGLYKGIVPNLLKVGPSIGVSFATYEFTKEHLDHWSREHAKD